MAMIATVPQVADMRPVLQAERHARPERKIMANQTNARNRAQSHFTSSEQRADAVRAEIEKERASVNAKTARLKALRVAKEAEDKIEADRLAAEAIAEKARIVAAKRAGKKASSGQN